MSIDEAAALQLAGGVVNGAILWRLATPDIVRLWSGPGDLAVGVDATEPTGATYRGVGDLLNLPALEALVNGAADRLDFSLSGAVVDSEAFRLADEEAASVRGAKVNIGLHLFDAAHQSLSTVWVWEGEADTPRLMSRTDADGTRTRTIQLSVGSLFTGRRRPHLSYYTDVEQRARSSDDKFCERTAIYAQGRNKTWPRF